MSVETHLIIDGRALPKTNHDRYACWEEDLSISLTMAAGNMVREIRGRVWRVRYSYDYMGDELLRQILEILRQGGSFQAAALPDNSDNMIAIRCFCTSLTPPAFAFSKNGRACWHGLAFELREIEPHD